MFTKIPLKERLPWVTTEISNCRKIRGRGSDGKMKVGWYGHFANTLWG